MSTKKIITVLGATGAQGGSVVNTFLNNPKLNAEWTVRAITRNPSKAQAQKLREKGAEVVTANLDDILTLIQAFTGAEVVFGVTNFWERMSKEVEVQQGKNIVDAAKKAHVPYLIWSSLRNIKDLSQGKLPHVDHFDSKAEVEKYAVETGSRSIFFLAGFYMQNLIGNLFRPEPPQNNWVLTLPTAEDAPIPLFDVENTGIFIKAIVSNRDRLIGKRVLGATKYCTPIEIVNDFKNQFPVVGEQATYRRLSNEDFQKRLVEKYGMPAEGALGSSETMLAMSEGGYFGFQSLDESLGLLEDEPTTWPDFLATKVHLS